MSYERPIRILLALDAESVTSGLLALLSKAIEAEVPDGNALIEPVYVIHADSLTLLDFVEGNFNRYKASLLAKLRGAIEKLDLPGLIPPTLLMAGSVTRQGCVKELLRYANETGADLIALTTRARHGARRWLAGSFAETLMAKSRLPLLIVNPNDTWSKKRIRTILYPTDLSASSNEGLDLLVRRLPERNRIKLILFHQVDIVPFLYGPYPSVPAPQKILDEDFAKRKQVGRESERELREKGVDARFVIRRKYLPVPDAILAQARRKRVDLIALVSHSSALRGTLLGSTARQILRKASCPVWVVHIKDSPLSDEAKAA